MPKRTEEEQAVIDKGKLWFAFWGTEWGKDLKRFIDEQERLGKDATADLVIDGEYERAKASGHKTAGIISVRTYINDCIGDMKQLQDEENKPQPTESEIPTHVKSHGAD